VFFASFGWGSGGVVTRMALDDGATPYEVALVRAALAGVGVILYLAIRGRLRRPGLVALKVGVVMSVTNMAMPFILSNIALLHASAGFVALPAALIPLMTAAMAHVFLPDERISVAKMVGLVTALAGVAVLLLSGDSGLAEGGRPLLAGALGLASVAVIAAGSVYAKKYAGRYGTLDVAALQFSLGAVFIVVAASFLDGGVGAGPVGAWPELVYLAVLATLVPVALFYWLIRHVTVTYASMIGYVVPLIAVVVGVIVLDEQVQPGIMIGGALILTGVIITDRLERRGSAAPAG